MVKHNFNMTLSNRNSEKHSCSGSGSESEEFLIQKTYDNDHMNVRSQQKLLAPTPTLEQTEFTRIQKEQRKTKFMKDNFAR